jgi:hypothetical protein
MSYCSTLKTFQVENVLCDEATRMNNNAAGDHEWACVSGGSRSPNKDTA